MTRNVHTVTHADGTTCTRTSGTRIYTHALVVTRQITEHTIAQGIRNAQAACDRYQWYTDRADTADDQGIVWEDDSNYGMDLDSARKDLAKAQDRLARWQAETVRPEYYVRSWHMSAAAAHKAKQGAQYGHQFQGVPMCKVGDQVVALDAETLSADLRPAAPVVTDDQLAAAIRANHRGLLKVAAAALGLFDARTVRRMKRPALVAALTAHADRAATLEALPLAA